jgi:8-oxo-dGTP diphosphatase
VTFPATIHVVAGVLHDAAGRVLIAQRPWATHLAGRWEFPGGKVQAGETIGIALHRELREELGIEVLCAQALAKFSHDYPDRSVVLDFARVTEWRGELRGLDGQLLRWEFPDRLLETGLLPADTPVVALLSRLSDQNAHRA